MYNRLQSSGINSVLEYHVMTHDASSLICDEEGDLFPRLGPRNLVKTSSAVAWMKRHRGEILTIIKFHRWEFTFWVHKPHRDRAETGEGWWTPSSEFATTSPRLWTSSQNESKCNWKLPKRTRRNWLQVNEIWQVNKVAYEIIQHRLDRISVRAMGQSIWRSFEQRAPKARWGLQDWQINHFSIKLNTVERCKLSFLTNQKRKLQPK